MPPTHNPCTIIKVHGDYLDMRIKNTLDELSKYDPRLDGLLDQIFDQFGLIICGWSADWDEALRAAIERTKGHRFTTYWTSRGKPSQTAQTLITLRQAQAVKIKDADTFFEELNEKVTSLEDLQVQIPISTKVAVATLKRYLVEDRNRIKLHDFVIQEAKNLAEQLAEKNYPTGNFQFTTNDEVVKEVDKRLRQYEAASNTLCALVATGCYWGNSLEQRVLWKKTLTLIANSAETTNLNGYDIWIRLRSYPLHLMLYSAGVAAVMAGNYQIIASLIWEIKFKGDKNQAKPLSDGFYLYRVLEDYLQKMLPVAENKLTPLSNRINKYLREAFTDLLPQDNEYQRCFDQFEYLLALIQADRWEKNGGEIWGQPGRFVWRYKYNAFEETLMAELEAEANSVGNEWAPLKAGLFEGKIERFLMIKQDYDAYLKRQGAFS